MDSAKRNMLREAALKEFGGKEATDDETKVRQLFSSFMNKKTGRIGFKEAKDYTLMTEGEKAVLHYDMWAFVCKYAWKGLFLRSLFMSPNQILTLLISNRCIGIQEL